MQRMSASELHAYLEQCAEPPLLLDVREPWEFDICHIENSQLIPMGQVPNALEDIEPEQEIVVICHHGIRSLKVAYYLEHMGYNKTINLDGGVEAWARDVNKSMPVY